MKFCIALTLLASAGNLATILSFPLVNDSGGANGLNDEGFAKRQNQQTLSLVMYSVEGIASHLRQDVDTGNIRRADATKSMVTTLWNNNQNYNYVICYTPHDYNFQGKQGVDWDHVKVEILVTFDVVVGGAGEFIRHGDGGYVNWAYIGAVKSRTEVDGDTVIDFNAP